MNWNQSILKISRIIFQENGTYLFLRIFFTHLYLSQWQDIFRYLFLPPPPKIFPLPSLWENLPTTAYHYLFLSSIQRLQLMLSHRNISSIKCDILEQFQIILILAEQYFYRLIRTVVLFDIDQTRWTRLVRSWPNYIYWMVRKAFPIQWIACFCQILSPPELRL